MIAVTHAQRRLRQSRCGRMSFASSSLPAAGVASLPAAPVVAVRARKNFAQVLVGLVHPSLGARLGARLDALEPTRFATRFEIFLISPVTPSP